MKVTSFILGLPLVASAAVVAPRQAGQAGHPKEVPDATFKGATRKIFTIKKAFSLKAGSGAAAAGGHSHGGGAKGMGGMGGMGMGGEADAQNFGAQFKGIDLCETCTVLSGQIRITYADGTAANVSNGLYVHHILTNQMGNQPGFVGGIMGNLGGAGFVGAGDDNGNTPFLYAPKDLSIKSGFWVNPGDLFTAQIVLVNYNTAPRTVYLNYDLEFIKGHDGMKKVKSSLISASGIGSPKTSTSRAVNTTSSPMKFSEGGYIILAKGHLHDGGNAMYMKINGKSSFSCVSRATYGGTIVGGTTKTISDMTNCNEKPVRVNKDDTMVMTAEYDLASHPLRQSSNGGEASAMGMFRIIFAPDAVW